MYRLIHANLVLLIVNKTPYIYLYIFENCLINNIYGLFLIIHGEFSKIFINFIFSVQLLGTFENRSFDDREVTFTIGEGCEENIIPGIEIAMENFKKNEKSRLKIKPRYAFGVKGSSEYNIPPNSTVEYEVTLKSFERAKDSWALDSNERIEQTKLFKEKGTKYFKDGKFELALKLYKKIQSYLEEDKGELFTIFCCIFKCKYDLFCCR